MKAVQMDKMISHKKRGGISLPCDIMSSANAMVINKSLMQKKEHDDE